MRKRGVSANRPVVRNTWGDGLYFVFRTARDAGLLAFDLAERIAGTRWSGLPGEMALHVGAGMACGARRASSGG